MTTPTLATSCAALPPEGAVPLWGGPAAEPTPARATSCPELPVPLGGSPARTLLRPALNFPPELLLKAQGIRVVFFDVDGVMTDGGLYITQAGETVKRFHTLDGHGLKLLKRAGITPAVITGRDSKPLRLRLAALGIDQVHYGTEEKYQAAEQTLKTLGLAWQQAAAMGDDWPDLALMRRCALACAPHNAHPEVRAVSHHVTSARGGDGAVREFCDLLLVASGKYADLLEESAR